MSSNTVFFCKECGYESAKWLGRCPGCNNWNTFVEEKVNKKSSSRSSGFSNTFSKGNTVRKLKDIEVKEEVRIDTCYDELNRVFGGGIVEGSLNLIGGEPGIGKSTLIMQVCSNLSKRGNVLYISGEESETQVKLRADRLNVSSDNILFLNETNISVIEEKIEEIKPKFLVIDSIQTMYDEDISSTPGSISQVKEVTGRLMYVAKNSNITTIVIGHVTKDGVIAGPRILEHMVDTVIYIEGERFLTHRIVRGVKNRFGSTNEIGIFDMKDEGMVEVKNISDVFLTKSEKNLPGTAIIATIEGKSTILMEVQALTTHSYYNIPRRVSNGIDLNRMNMLIAVLEKRCNFSLSTQDIYVNVVGGMRVEDPASDLGVAIAIISSYKNIVISPKTVFLGEVGLTGEIRGVTNFEKRVKEISKLGYNKIYANKKQVENIKEKVDATLVGVSSIDELTNRMK